ncbi:hypothetical protein BG011_007282 [Mortierella polycephala]|uniref:Uncharacterized protein n=1 Tax=Mortierella polycephala TaxID=41804 RepID=A0A9P6PSF0_9FUNG|nr:hypothetical protein BG011_007282 [Mortierella polycephala]
MADEKLTYGRISEQVHQNSQPINTHTFPSTTNTASNSGIQPIVSPKSQCKKTGTRSTFCPNTLHKGTKLTEEDYEEHEKHKPQPTGWLQMLGLKKNANYGETIDKGNEPHDQSYY